MRARLMVQTIPSFLLGIGVVLILWGAVLPHSVAASAELRGGTCCTTTTLQGCPDQLFIGSCNMSVFRCDEMAAGFTCEDDPGGVCDSESLLCKKMKEQSCSIVPCP